MITLKEFIGHYNRVYGKANVTVNNVAELTTLSIGGLLLDLDAKMIATDGVLSSHKTESYMENEDYMLKSSVNVRKAKWVAIASIAFVKQSETDENDVDVVVNILINVVGDSTYEDIADDMIKNYMRI